MHLFDKFASDTTPSIESALYYAMSGAIGGRSQVGRAVINYTEFDYILKGDGSTIWSIEREGSATDQGADLGLALATICTAANMPNGGKVLIDYDGTLQVTSSQLIDSVNNLHIVGTPNLTVQASGFSSGTVWDCIKFNNCDDAIIEGFTIDGNRSSYIWTIPVTDDAGNCLHFDSCERYMIRDMYLKAGLFHGFFGSGQTISGTLMYTKMTGNGYRGCHIHGGAVFSIDGFRTLFNEVWANGQYISAGLSTGLFMAFDNAYDAIIMGNHIHDETGAGMELSGLLSSTVSAQKVSVIGNTLDGNAYGIRCLLTMIDMVVSGNTIRGCTNWAMELNTVQNTSITDNIIADNADWGIYCNNSIQKHINMSGNILKRNQGGAMRLRGEHFSVCNNQLADNTVSGGGAKDQISCNTLLKANIKNNNISDDNWANTLRAIYVAGSCKDVHVVDNMCGNTGPTADIRFDNGAVGCLNMNNRYTTLVDNTVTAPALVTVNDVASAFN